MVMASDSRPSLDLDLVVRKFVETYYKVLTTSPWNLYRFYNSESAFLHSSQTYPEIRANGITEAQKICASLPYSNKNVMIQSVSSQRGLMDSLLVQVTGLMDSKLFLQTFVLAKQDEGKYDVQNDVLHVLDQSEYSDLSVKSNESPIFLFQTKQTKVSVNGATVDGQREETRDEKMSELEVETVVKIEQPVSAAETIEKPPEKEAISAVPKEKTDSVQESVSVEDTRVDKKGIKDEKSAIPPKPKSWASVVKKPEDVEAEDATEKAVSVEERSAEAVATKSSPDEGAEGVLVMDVEGPSGVQITQVAQDGSKLCAGLWIGQIPSAGVGVSAGSVARSLRDLFSKYGNVARVDVRMVRGYAFVDLDSMESTFKCVEGWNRDGAPLEGPLKGRQLTVKVRTAPQSSNVSHRKPVETSSRSNVNQRRERKQEGEFVTQVRRGPPSATGAASFKTGRGGRNYEKKVAGDK